MIKFLLYMLLGFVIIPVLTYISVVILSIIIAILGL